jgi:hypothetical protein
MGYNHRYTRIFIYKKCIGHIYTYYYYLNIDNIKHTWVGTHI